MKSMWKHHNHGKCNCNGHKMDWNHMSKPQKTASMGVGGLLLLAGAACLVYKMTRTIPKGVSAVKPFSMTHYLGKWYEIARMDYSHEKNLEQVTAEYSMNVDGTIKVVNKGYNTEKGEWEEATGKAKHADDSRDGRLKVSFFGPFYDGYNVIAIDPEYKNALVIGKNHNYMWLLSRDKSMPEDIKEQFLFKARKMGFDTSKLTWTKQR